MNLTLIMCADPAARNTYYSEWPKVSLDPKMFMSFGGERKFLFLEPAVRYLIAG